MASRRPCWLGPANGEALSPGKGVAGGFQLRNRRKEKSPGVQHFWELGSQLHEWKKGKGQGQR